MRFFIAFIFTCIVAIGAAFGQTGSSELQSAADLAFNETAYIKAINLYNDARIAYYDEQKVTEAIDCTIGIGKCQIALGRFNEATKDLEATIARTTKEAGTSKAQQAMLYKLLGEAYLNNGLNQQALDVFSKSEQLITNKNDLFYADLMEEIGVAYWNSGNNQLAIEHHQLALQKRTELLEDGHELIADSYINLGLVAMGEDYVSTFTYLNKALNIYEKQFGENHQKVANAYFNLGMADLENQTYSQATRYFEKVAGIYEVIYQQNHPNKAIIQSTLGRVD
ncbi:MAG: tetratricopeptide repeat protein, partial [Bacteroidota bacterium]